MVFEEEDIIERLRRRDESCMRILFDRYYRALCAYALKYLSSIEDAEDTVQNVLISFWEKKQGQRFVGSVRAYLFSAVGKASLKLLEQRGRFVFDDIESHVNHLLDEALDFEEDPEAWKERLRQEVDNLPEKSKAVFTAIVLENLSYKQAAERYGVSVNTVKTLYSHALKKLRDNLGDLFLLAFFFGF